MRDATILSTELHGALRDIAAKLEEFRPIRKDVRDLVALLGSIDPEDLPQAESEIVMAAALHRWRRQPLVGRLFGCVTDAKQLRSVDGLEYLFLFHRDGWLREAALRKIEGPLPNAFLFAAVAWRLNDWVAPVRRAADACARASFPLTPASIIADAALILQTRQGTWGRWGAEKLILEAAFERDDVADHLADILVEKATGPMASTLRQSMRSIAMDRHLQRLATDALQPAVRATAMQSLIEGVATWPIGWQWQWVDKPLGIRRRQPLIKRRPLTVPSDRSDMIRRGLKDRAATVRTVAISGLIEDMAALPDARRLASDALADRSAAVRERAAFILSRPDIGRS
jgi:hypothetical protein